MTAFFTSYTLLKTRLALLDAYAKYLDNDEVIAWEATENPLLTVEVTPIYEKELKSIRDRASKPALRKQSIRTKKVRRKVHKARRGGVAGRGGMADKTKKAKKAVKDVLYSHGTLHGSLRLGQYSKGGSGLSSKKPSYRKRPVRHGASPQKGGGAQKGGTKGGIKSLPLPKNL